MFFPGSRSVIILLAALWAALAGVSAQEEDKDQGKVVNINDLIAASRYGEAYPHLVKLEADWNAAVRDEDSDYNLKGWARTLLALGTTEFELSKTDDAISDLGLARDIAVEIQLPDHFVGDCLDALGRALQKAGHYAEAEEALLGAIENRMKNPDAELRMVRSSKSRDHLGLLYLTWGRPDEAGRLFEQTLRESGDDPIVRAQRHIYLAKLYHALRSYASARDHYERALELAEGHWGESDPWHISLVGSLGLTCLRLGEDQRAERLLREAATLAEKLPPTHRVAIELADYLNNLGLLALHNREFEDARDIFSRARDTLISRLGDGSPSLCPFYNNLGYANYRLEDYPAAREAYYQAAVRYRHSVGEQHQRYIETNNNLILNNMLAGETGAEVEKLVEENIANALVVFDKVRAFGTERQRLNYFQRVDLVSLPCTLGKDVDLIANTVLRTKGRLLDTLLVEEQSSEVLKVLRAKQRMRDDILFRAESQDRLDELRDEIAILQTKAQEEAGPETLPEASWSAVQASLPLDSAFVDFVRYRDYRAAPDGPHAYGAILIVPDETPQWIPLGSEEKLRVRLDLVKECLDYRAARLAGYKPSSPPAGLRATLRKIHDLFWKPVAERLPETTETIGLSPDGSLNFVSFAVLLDEQDRFLAAKYKQIVYLSSGRDLLVEDKRPALREGPWAVVAVPNFEKKGATGEEVSNNALDRVVFETVESFPPVPGAKEELKRLHRIIPESARGIELTNASEVDLRKMSVSPVVLHLTTHAFFLPSVRDDLENAIQDFDEQPERLYRSGLVLTEAKRALAQQLSGVEVPFTRDGILFSDEVKDLPLQNTRLVTLSSCESGLGEAVSGEGVLGLRRGFTLAGASNIMISLWPVSDSSTPAFMERVYRLALATDRIGQSLWTAQQLSLHDVDPNDDAEIEEAVLRYGCFVLCQRGPLQSVVPMPELKEPINKWWIGLAATAGGLALIVFFWPRKQRY